MNLAVLIPVYNAEAYLRECLDSVIAAGRRFVAEGEGRRFTIFCGLDGATDGSEGILNEYAKRLANEGEMALRFFKHANIGVSATRNDLLDNLSPEIDAVGFVDSDDWIDSDMFVKLVSALEKEDADVAECGVWNGDDWNEPSWINIVNKLYRRSAIGDVRFRKGLAFEEDNFFNREVNRNVRKRVAVNEPLYHYRDNPSSVTSALDLKKYFASVAERVRLTVEIFGMSPELAKDAYRMVIRKNLKKNRNPVERRELFLAAGEFLSKYDFSAALGGLNIMQRTIFRSCLNRRYALSRVLVALT